MTRYAQFTLKNYNGLTKFLFAITPPFLHGLLIGILNIFISKSSLLKRQKKLMVNETNQWTDYTNSLLRKYEKPLEEAQSSLSQGRSSKTSGRSNYNTLKDQIEETSGENFSDNAKRNLNLIKELSKENLREIKINKWLITYKQLRDIIKGTSDIKSEELPEILKSR